MRSFALCLGSQALRISKTGEGQNRSRQKILGGKEGTGLLSLSCSILSRFLPPQSARSNESEAQSLRRASSEGRLLRLQKPDTVRFLPAAGRQMWGCVPEMQLSRDRLQKGVGWMGRRFLAGGVCARGGKQFLR